MRLALTALTLLLLVSPTAFADRPLSPFASRSCGNERSENVADLALGLPVYGGSGCPKGSVSVAFAPDNLSFSVIYSSFVAATPGRFHFFDTKNCSVIIPLKVPEGMQVRVSRVDYRGFVSLPVRNSFGVFNARYGFRPRYGRIPSSVGFGHRFQGPIAEDYFLSSGDLHGGQGVEVGSSGCGGVTQLRLDSSLLVYGPPDAEMQMTLDGVDGTARSVYFLDWQRCRAR